jgi:Kef-type K+ transport system membrane component KefB
MPTNFDLAMHLFLQLAVILGTCRVVGYALRYLGQTQVVSEMIAGVLLGPSLLGIIAPGVQHYLFPTSYTLALQNATDTIPHPSMTILYALSQLGLVLYMFLIGLQFNTNVLSKHVKHAMSISLSGILLPVLLGGALGFALSNDQRLFASTIAPWQAALFLASAMSITAFPMLARIIYEHGIAHTTIGTLAIGAAAFDDAAAWSLLAVVLATSQGSPAIAVLAIGGGIAYAVAMITVGRPLFRRFERMHMRDNGVRIELLAMVLLVLVLCAWFTDKIGIYSIFGAFIAGTVMPRGRFATEVAHRLESLTVAFLLPIFFVYSGLNTRIGLLFEPSLFWLAVGTVIIAFGCKGGGCLLATRLGGASWQEAALVGVLMNARGLMELILINIGLEEGLISPALFTILVVMAILTTFVASPLFHLLYGQARTRGSFTPAATSPAPLD